MLFHVAGFGSTNPRRGGRKAFGAAAAPLLDAPRRATLMREDGILRKERPSALMVCSAVGASPGT